MKCMDDGKLCSMLYTCPCENYCGPCDFQFRPEWPDYPTCKISGAVCKVIYVFKCKNGKVDGLNFKQHEVITNI